MQVLQLSLQSSHRPSSIPRKTFRGTKLCMNLFLQAQAQAQVQTQAQVNRSDQAPRKRPLKAPPPDLYFGKSHMECYHFCQQCEDHFDTAGATGTNRIPFAASFLRGRISFRWHQHKRRSQVKGPLSWVKFKSFLRRNSETVGLSWTPSAVGLNETLSSSRRKFRIGLLTSSISNPSISSLTLTEPQKSPTSFDSSGKDSSHW